MLLRAVIAAMIVGLTAGLQYWVGVGATLPQPVWGGIYILPLIIQILHAFNTDPVTGEFLGWKSKLPPPPTGGGYDDDRNAPPPTTPHLRGRERFSRRSLLDFYQHPPMERAMVLVVAMLTFVVVFMIGCVSSGTIVQSVTAFEADVTCVDDIEVDASAGKTFAEIVADQTVCTDCAQALVATGQATADIVADVLAASKNPAVTASTAYRTAVTYKASSAYRAPRHN